VILSPRIVFMGSPEFAVPILEALARQYPIAGVVTQPDRPSGRSQKLLPPPVKDFSLKHGFPIFQPEKIRDPQAVIQLNAWAPDLIIVAAYGQILRQSLLSLPPLGCLNVHGSILPRWRGASPIQSSILYGDETTGITIMVMDPGMDTGPILSQRELPIRSDDTSGSLSTRMAALGADLLMDTLPGFLKGTLLPATQPQEGVTYSQLLKKEDGGLDLSQKAVDLERRVRAMNPWPGAFFEWLGSPMKVHRARLSKEKSPGVGSRFIREGSPAVGTGEGILILEEVQPAGKKLMTGKAFLSGSRNWSDK
jgi:methionyl-tRNA formyltransferase